MDINDFTNVNKGTPSTRYSNDFEESFSAFQEIKKILNFNKFIICFKI